MNEASRAQILAAAPEASTWLAANAGSGKTRVLTDRVARLLLRGVDPQHILCLTYTKAAASEMQNRLFQRLGDWAMLDARDLRAQLQDLGESPDQNDPDFTMARTLFARAIETPGGLKIQTIHSFCASLLRRFPLEAGVNPQFQEIDERASADLRAQVLEEMAEQEPALFSQFSRHFTGSDLVTLTAEMSRHQELFFPPLTWPDIAARFEVPELLDTRALEDMLFTGGEAALLTRLTTALLGASTKLDPKFGQQLSQITELSADSFDALASVFLTTTGTMRKNFPSKGVRAQIEPDLEPLSDFIARVHRIAQIKHAYAAAQKTHALHLFAVPFLQRYERAKLRLGWLDFDDLILRTRALLTEPKVADWVLFRLDGGISHILVDEAQDTSPAQWDVIRKLTQDFTSGQGIESETERTIFVVGDKKQSIYSFQGADPDAFDQMQAEFDTRLAAIERPLANRSLQYSFRSAGAILQLVDHTFEGQRAAGFTPEGLHRAFHDTKPGRVDLWPCIAKAEDKDDRHWSDPVDRVPETHHHVRLARQIADQIAQMLDPQSPAVIPENGADGFHLRAVQAGDIMILVQSRGGLFREIIQACKRRDLPIAGADRLKVGAELAVRDLLALLSFLATPEDDLSLATVLRSPLLGWSEQALFTLSHGRKGYLWEVLRENGPPEQVGMLKALRNNIDFLRPYDLLEEILTRYEGRAKLLARLGKEAEDGINAILTQALRYEEHAIPSLTGFLSWARADELEIKRQIDSSGNLIRVMTVHGAKGLEAPIVILPDCAKKKTDVKETVLAHDGLALWKTASGDPTPLMVDAIAAVKEADARENLRLLYVALTRAESWLIVAGSGELDLKSQSDWYQTIETGMQKAGARPHEFPFGPGLRFETGAWDLDQADHHPNAPDTQEPLHPIFTQALTKEPKRHVILSPSDLGGAKALPSTQGLPKDIAKAYGIYLHELIEKPGASPLTELPQELCREAKAEAARVLADPHLAWIFAPHGLAEVTVHGRYENQPILGTIDRLIITETRVIAIDFKTNREIPKSTQHCPEGLLRQMGAYHHMLRQIYPDHKIETGLLWTRATSFMSLPEDLLTAALARSPQLDGVRPAP